MRVGIKHSTCYLVWTAQKLIRCNWETGADAACQKRCSCRTNGFFCVMVCYQCHGECSNKSKSLIIDDIDEDNDCNVFDAAASFS